MSEIAPRLKFKMPGWMNYWSIETLKKRCAEVGPRAFERGYRQRPYASDEMLFPNFVVNRNYLYNEDWRILSSQFYRLEDDGTKTYDPYLTEGEENDEFDKSSPYYVDPNWPRFIGVDLSFAGRSGNVICVIAVDPSSDTLHVLEVLSAPPGEGWTSPQTAEQLSVAIGNHFPDLVYVEKNGYQRAIIEWMQAAGVEGWSKIESYWTGEQKMDPEIGLPSLDVKFAAGQFKMAIPHSKDAVVQPDPRDPTKCLCNRCRLKRDIEVTTREDDTPDTVMALWISKEASRAGVRFTTPIKVVAVKTSSVRQVAANRYFDPTKQTQITASKAAFGDMKAAAGITKDFGREIKPSASNQAVREREAARRTVDATKLVRIINAVREGGRIEWADLNDAEAFELDRMLTEKIAIYERLGNDEQVDQLSSQRRYREL